MDSQLLPSRRIAASASANRDNDADANKSTAPLSPGASITLGSVTVTFLSQDASGDRVHVVR